ncbi:MAG TPA: 2'-5' RNA ligase family protein [Verrucomicrobiae bacterium]|nr:2'-5' RNA ligase family protein [Verrucomicrobiae bacterium]
MKRIQLSLFITGAICEVIERVRRRVDPVQSTLIPAHVTLCREDELGGVSLDALVTRLAGYTPLRLAFGDVVAFGGHGIMARCSEGAEFYSQLRRSVLGADAREARPHITLAHPRNPRAPGNVLDAIDLEFPLHVVFDTATLIEEEAVGLPWRVVREFPIGSFPAPNEDISKSEDAKNDPVA